MSIDTGNEVFTQSHRHEKSEPVNAPFYFENPNWLRLGRRVRLEWISARLVQTLLTVSAKSRSGEDFSYTQPKFHTQDDLYSVTGTITKALPRKPYDRRGEARTLHFTPDPLISVTESGVTREQSQPPMIIPEANYANFIVTAVEKVRSA